MSKQMVEKEALILQKLLETARKEGRKDDKSWKFAKKALCQGCILIPQLLGNGAWHTVLDRCKEKGVLVKSFLYCFVRYVQDAKLSGDRVLQYMGGNHCKQCSSWLIDVSALGFGTCQMIPEPSHVKEWIDTRCRTPGDLAMYALEVLKSLVPGLDDKEAKALGLSKVSLAKQLLSNCYWDVQHVAVLAECIMHSIHPRKGILFYPCVMNLESVKDYLAASSENSLSLPPYDEMYVTVHYDGHNALLCLLRSERYVVVLDGWEKRPEKKEKADQVKLDTIMHWQGLADALLQLFGEIERSGGTVMYGFGDHTGIAAVKEDWTLLSVTDLPPSLKKKLIPQTDTYSCGPIAILNLMQNVVALDEKIAKNAEKGSNVATCIKDLGMVEKINGWVKDCCNRSELPENFNELFVRSPSTRTEGSKEADEAEPERQENSASTNGKGTVHQAPDSQAQVQRCNTSETSLYANSDPETDMKDADAGASGLKEFEVLSSRVGGWYQAIPEYRMLVTNLLT